MTNDIVIHAKTMEKNLSIPSGKELAEIVETTKLLATCPYYQKMGPGGILAIWLSAREMGLPLMMCLNGGMYTFSGLVSLSSNLMNMMICNAGHRAHIIHSDDNKCTIQFWRRDRPRDNCTFEWSYTKEDAAKANLLGKSNWKTNLRDMLFNRCLSGGARKFMPDVIMGAYAIGELPGDDGIIDGIPSDMKIPEPEKPKTITQEQVDYLNCLINEFDDIKIKLDKKLGKSNLYQYKDIPIDMFSKVEQYLMTEISMKKQSKELIEQPHSMDELYEQSLSGVEDDEIQ